MRRCWGFGLTFAMTTLYFVVRTAMPVLG